MRTGKEGGRRRSISKRGERRTGKAVEGGEERGDQKKGRGRGRRGEEKEEEERMKRE